MTLPSQRWMTIIFFVTAFVFLSVAVYLYGLQFFAWAESDAAVSAILGAKVLDAKLPVVDNWYYANGDVWMVAPHLIAVLPVAVLGLGQASLLITVVLGFLLELFAFVKIYLRLCGELWVALFATMVTMMAWSHAHVAFAYIQLGYGFLTFLCMVSFSTFATLASDAPSRWWRWAFGGLFIAFVASQNPTRSLAYMVAPLLAACVWPWRGVGVRRRLAIAGTAIGGWALAFIAYGALTRVVALSVPRGHMDFMIADAGGIVRNVGTLLRGLAILCGGDGDLSLLAIPGLLVLVGAIAFVVREILRSRAFTAIRFISVIAIAQFGVVLIPLLIGSLLDSPSSVRYAMPSVLIMFGLAAILAIQALAGACAWARRLATAWLVLVPVAAIVALPSVRPPQPQSNTWPDTAELEKIADALVERGLTHGFSSVLEANLLTMQSGGAAMTCPVFFRDLLIPQRWLADTSCFTSSALPERFFLVAELVDHNQASVRATLPAPAERFRLGDTYEVSVYPTAQTPLAWLDLPVLDGKLATFPLRIPATNLQFGRGVASVEPTQVLATGESGSVLYGPYIKLPKGTYEMVWLGSGVDSAGQIAFSARSDAGAKVLAHVVFDAKNLPRGRAELVRLRFKVDDTRQILEFPVESGAGGRVVLHELVIENKR